jgi:hypothetical protein
MNKERKGPKPENTRTTVIFRAVRESASHRKKLGSEFFVVEGVAFMKLRVVS